MTGDRDGDVHVIPDADAHPHAASVFCWCEPGRDVEAPAVVVHRTFDDTMTEPSGALH
jgi:hypothetical protein